MIDIIIRNIFIVNWIRLIIVVIYYQSLVLLHNNCEMHFQLALIHGHQTNLICHYIKTCVKRQLSKRPQLSLDAGQKYCRMLQGEHSAIILTFIKLPFVIKIFIFSIYKWSFYTDLHRFYCSQMISVYLYLFIADFFAVIIVCAISRVVLA